MKYTLKILFSWREGLRRTFHYTTGETIHFFQTGPYNFHWIRIFVLSSLVSKPICRLIFSPLGNFANFCLWDLCTWCGFHLLQWVELLSRRDRVNVPQNQHAKPFGACVAKWVTTQSLLSTVLGEGSFLSPVFMRMNYLEVLQKAVACSCYPLGKWEQMKPHLIFIRQIIIINWVTHSHKTATEQSCGLWRPPLALRHSDSHTSLNLNHPEMRIGFPIQERNKPTFAALW